MPLKPKTRFFSNTDLISLLANTFLQQSKLGSPEPNETRQNDASLNFNEIVLLETLASKSDNFDTSSVFTEDSVDSLDIPSFNKLWKKQLRDRFKYLKKY